MSNGHDIPDLERLTFFSGQRLTASDLAGLQKVERERAWLHNRSLHGWGIGMGFAVIGEAGASVVEIGEGYAVDCLGREIILTETKTLTVPAVAGTPSGGEAVYYLVAGYQGNAQQAVAERRPGVCMPGGTVRLTEEPRLEWREAAQEGLDVILAKAWVRNCQLSRPLSLNERRSARPSQHPYIAANQTEAGNTDWQAWTQHGSFVGVRVRVDTSVARFQTTPNYFAHVVGSRYILATEPDIEGGYSIWVTSGVTDATPTGFVLEVLVLDSSSEASSTDPESWLAQLQENPAGVLNNEDLGWHVVWMGVEA